MKSLLLFLLVAVATFAAEAPNLKSIAIPTRATPITNARVASVTERGITFICDQGMLQVPFSDLPAEFAYYKTAIKPTVTQAPKVAPPVKAVTNTPAPKPKSPVDAARKAKQDAEQRDILRAKITRLNEVIDRYTRQSSFSGEKLITSQEYDLAKAELEEAKAKLAGLEN